MKFIRHIVLEMEDLVQRCLVCGQIVNDESNSVWPKGKKPKGWPAGRLYISEGQPRHYTIQQYLPPDAEVENCKRDEQKTTN